MRAENRNTTWLLHFSQHVSSLEVFYHLSIVKSFLYSSSIEYVTLYLNTQSSDEYEFFIRIVLYWDCKVCIRQFYGHILWTHCKQCWAQMTERLKQGIVLHCRKNQEKTQVLYILFENIYAVVTAFKIKFFLVKTLGCSCLVNV